MRASGVVILCFVLAWLSDTPLHAAYIVDGQVEGSVCTNYFVFQKCRFVDVDAMKGQDGELFEVTRKFENVTEYQNGLCFIRLKYDGWIAWGAHKTFGPTFFTKRRDGQFERIDPDYVVFKCKKQD